MLGRIGSIVASVFIYYDRIVAYHGALRSSTLFEDIDTLMLRVSDEKAVVSPGPKRGHPSGGVAIPAAVTALVHIALVLARLQEVAS